MTSLPLQSQIEAILFFKGEPVSIKKLEENLKVTKEEIEIAINELRKDLSLRGIVLLEHDSLVSLGTHPEASPLIEKITKEELLKDLGKAGLETLAIILYKKEVLKREIDYIRGVNSSFILRNLLIRGLIEKIEKEGIRGFAYKPTIDLLAYLGIQKIEDLPEYSKVFQELEDFSKKEEDLEK